MGQTKVNVGIYYHWQDGALIGVALRHHHGQLSIDTWYPDAAPADYVDLVAACQGTGGIATELAACGWTSLWTASAAADSTWAAAAREAIADQG